MPKIPTKKHTNLDDSIYTRKDFDRQNNIIIGIAVGVMVVACSLILLVMFVNK